MPVKGQSALDLLLALLVLLIVLNVFTSVLTRFGEVQKEISIRQQLRENLSLISVFTTYSGGLFYRPNVYPPTNTFPAFGTLLVDYTNHFTRTFGSVALEQVRATGVQTTISCTTLFDVNIDVVRYGVYARGIDTGLPIDVDANAYAIIRPGYDANHHFVSTGCFDYFSIEVFP